MKVWPSLKSGLAKAAFLATFAGCVGTGAPALAQQNQPQQPQAGKPAASGGFRTAAIVNENVISSFDLEQRVRLVLVTSGQAPSPETAKRIRGQVLRTLIDEMLQAQEAAKSKVQVTDDDLNKSLTRIAQQNGTTIEKIYGMLDENGVARSSLQAQIRAELAWQKFIQARLAPRVTVSQEEIQSVLERTKATADRSQFLVSEIFMTVDSPDQEPEVRKSIQNIRDQVMAGAPFGAVARQFSQSSSAATGGDIGWVAQGQLAPELDAALSKMRPGTVSEPVRGAGGFYLVALRQKQSAAGSKPEPVEAAPPPPPQAQAQGGQPRIKIVKGPSAQIGLARVVIPIAPNAPANKLEEAKQKAITLYRGINGCGNLASVVKSVGAQATNMGQLPFNDLQPDFKKILSQVPNGRSTPPLRSNQGIEMFVVCSGGSVIQVERPAAPIGGAEPASTRVEPFKVPTKEDIESRLFNQQLSMLARRHLRDLRRDSTIDIREE